MSWWYYLQGGAGSSTGITIMEAYSGVTTSLSIQGRAFTSVTIIPDIIIAGKAFGGLSNMLSINGKAFGGVVAV